MSSGGGTTTKAAPWKGVQDYLKYGYRAAQRDVLGKEFFPDQTYVDYSPETEAALGGITERAIGGSPLIDAAQQAATGMLGDFDWQRNPYTDQVTESVRASVLPAVQSSFGMAGRTGDSPLAQGIIAREMTNALAPLQFQDMARQQGLHQQGRLGAMGMAPGLANVDYQDLARLGAVGAARETKSAEELRDQMARYENPVNRLNQYMQALSGSAPLIGQNMTQQNPNPIFGLLGAGITAAPFFSNPYGAAAAGAIGAGSGLGIF